jgi:hypothetical protein
MAYVGTPIDTRNQFQSLQGKRFNGDGSTTDFTLDVAPGSTLDIEVFVGNVRQDPNSAYTLSGTTLSFTGAPPSGTNNIYVVHQAKSVGTIDVPALGVSTASLQANSVTGAKLNTDVISAQTALAETPADTDEFLVSDAGTIKRIDFSHIKSVAGTNSFKAEMSATNTSISDNTYTKVAFDTDTFDTDSVFDTSNNRFIAPADGKYFFVSSVYMYANTANGSKSFTTFYKNGSIDNRTVTAIELGGSDNYLASTTILNSAIFNLSQNDYIEVYAKMDVPSGNLSFNLTHSFFSGYRIA